MTTAGSLDLELTDTTGRPLRLANYRGRSMVFVYFMRATTCPQCNAAAQRLVERAAKFQAERVEVLIAVPETRDRAAEWKEKRKIPFTVVVGASGTVHAEAGLIRKVFGAIQQSGSILLDLDGIVRYRHIATNPGASYRAADVEAAIRSVASTT